MSVGVPIKVLHDAEGHIVTIESMEGIIYRGKLVEAEDNMNCHMADLTVTTREGRVLQLQTIYMRGSKIRFLILPDMLKNSPMLKMSKTSATGRGRGTLIRSALPGRGRGGFRGAPRGRGFR